MKLVIASNNKGKIREYKQILEPLGYEVFSQSEAGLILDVEETGTTFAENSALKARAAFKLCGCAVLADDSGLEIDALDGEPGVYSARYGGLETDDERTALVLKKMKEIPDDKRGAHFTCTIHFIKADGEEIAVVCPLWFEKAASNDGRQLLFYACFFDRRSATASLALACASSKVWA